MTDEAPAAIALVTSPEYLIPPSEMIGTFARAAAAHSATAVNCGTPAPATIRVVQMEPGPTRQHLPARPSRGRVPAHAPRRGRAALQRAPGAQPRLAMPVRGAPHAHVPPGFDEQRHALLGTPPAPNRRAHAQASMLILA